MFIFPSPDKLRPPLLRIEDGYFSYTETDYILRNINFAVDMESRIAIVGANGVGKSTLLKLLVGQLSCWASIKQQKEVSLKDFEFQRRIQFSNLKSVV